MHRTQHLLMHDLHAGCVPFELKLDRQGVTVADGVHAGHATNVSGRGR